MNRRVAPNSLPCDDSSKEQLSNFTLGDLVKAAAFIPHVFDFMNEREGEESTGNRLATQDALAACLRCEWENETGVSKTYLCRLLRHFLKHEESVVSDDLLALWAIILASPFSCGDPMINGTSQQSSYVSYRFVNSILAGSSYLSLRVFSHHNDVSLRLWEAGAVLSEYLLQAPQLVRNKFVVELGAGVGLTSLVAALCGARHIWATDYSNAALENLRFNCQNNRESADKQCRSAGSKVKETFLDWNLCRSRRRDDVLDSEGIEALNRSSVLLAADVIYDEPSIPGLVETMRFFLRAESLSLSNPSSARVVLLATTLRNKSTFESFRNQLRIRRDISVELVADGGDCERLPLVFPTHFVQPRSDVRIYALRLAKLVQ